ncbi:hypothetical protein CO006_00610 [Candidatus Roizmanbacteria bacterium CG_4_8_14_3_um_filter_35_14]|nr:MAG: hypothetical protein CO006_00610 [Candidatus Roizmanbacteria bacterium CG_4_8_14_3_um_filter_35_14]
MLLVFLVILIISFILALRSMKDFDMPNEIKKLLQNQKIRGTIIFLKDKSRSAGLFFRFFVSFICLIR